MKDQIFELGDKLISIDEAVCKIESDMEIVVSQVSEPQGLLKQFHTIADKVRNVKVFLHSPLTRLNSL